MADDEFEFPTCDVCGSPCDPCKCNCNHVWRRDMCVFCAKELEPVAAEAEAADE